MDIPTGPDTPPQPLAFSKPVVTADDIAAVTAVLESGWLTTGEQAKAFEAELAAYLNIGHVVTTSSCTTAEEICLAFLDLPPGSTVGLPTWTFVSTALAAVRLGHKVVLIDVDPTDLNLCPAALERALSDGLDVVVGVHFGGRPFSGRIRELCSEAGVPLVEDAAHAFGAADDRGLVAGKGTVGACFSFYATKNLSTGEGGAIATDNAALAEFARVYRLHGMSADALDRYAKPGAHTYDVALPGIKANFPDLLAALGRTQLARFDESQARRRDLVDRYRSGLDAEAVNLIPSVQDVRSADHLMVIDAKSVEKRNKLIEMLTEHQIGSSVHFRPVHTFRWFRENNVALGPGGVPVADELDGRVMSLPLHANMTLGDVDRVCAVVGALR